MILHILNGDGTFPSFKESGIPGDIVVWREILSEGPVKNLPDNDFFRLRADYICGTSGELPEKYFQQINNELSRIKSSNQYDKIYLWFEHDLLCQINLVYLLKILLQNTHSEIFVVQF